MIDFASFLPTLGFLGYVLYRLEFAFTGGQFVVYLILVANGLLFLFATVLAVASLSFWTTQSSGLARIFDSLMKVGRYPIEIFEGFWRSIFLYILPLVLIAQLPSERKRCELAAALLHDPKIILLDEPTNAMDLMSAGRVRQFIRDEAREGNRAVIVTSHNISDIESACERVTILDKGRILYDGPRRNLNLHHRSVKRIRVRFQGPLQMASLSPDRLPPPGHVGRPGYQHHGPAARGDSCVDLRENVGKKSLLTCFRNTAFTRLHLDHTADLAPVLFALRNSGIGRTKTLTLLGATGFQHRDPSWLHDLPRPGTRP